MPEPGTSTAGAVMGVKALGFSVAGGLASAAVIATVPPTRIAYGADGAPLVGRGGTVLRVFDPGRALAMLLVTVLGSIFGGELLVNWLNLQSAPLTTQISIAFMAGIPAWGLLGIVLHSLEARQRRDVLEQVREVRDVIRGGGGGQ